MDLNESVVHFSRANGIAKLDNFGDTALSLKCLGSSAGRLMGSSHHNHELCSDVSNCPDDGCRLVLGLGPTPPSFYYNVRVNINKKVSASSGSVQELSSGGNSILQLGPPAAPMDTFSGLDCLLLTLTYTESNVSQPVVDEGSTSAKRSGGYMLSLLFAPRTENVRQPSRMLECSTNFGTDAYNSQLSHESEFSVGAFSDRTASATSSQHRGSNPEKCKFMGCAKGARGASGLCIGDGGGQRCQKAGCNKGAESKTTFCKAHGGGKRCQHLGCTKSVEGKTDFCISHGGGRRCGFPEGCAKAARGKSGLCIKHGGGKRCRIEGCTRSTEGQAGLCISHGGGRRCQSSGCTKGAQGSTNYCKAHGGGKRCIFAGCTKGAEGSTPLCKAHGGGKRCMFDGGGICPKSVHGGTSFCVAHGGGKRCVVAGCKSARGRTDCCVKHGGWKRCKSVGCEKSAQGSTDFCKAHGGGKRCSWGGDWKCEKFARGKSGLCAAHNSMSQEIESTKDLIARLGAGANSGRASTAEKKLEKLLEQELIEKPFQRKQMKIRFPERGTSGRSVVTVKNIDFGFEDKMLFKKANLAIERGEKIAIIGPNGCGKSTLLKLIMGLEKPLKGEVILGEHNVLPNYFEQNQAEVLDLEKTVLETVCEAAQDWRSDDIKGLLGRCNFKADMLDRKVSLLSGGEKARLAFCKFMVTPSTLLVLDEPTNHLDIPSKEMLEEAINEYQGTVIAVSHDRYFIKQIVNRVIEVEDGCLEDYAGDYNYYLEKNLEARVKAVEREAELEEKAPKVKAKSKMSKAEKEARKKQKVQAFQQAKQKSKASKNSKRWN